MADPKYHDENGNFKPGNPGGGRPPGVPALADKLRKMMVDNADELRDTYLGMLQEGDRTAWTLAMERVWNVKHELELSGDPERPVQIYQWGSDDDE